MKTIKFYKRLSYIIIAISVIVLLQIAFNFFNYANATFHISNGNYKEAINYLDDLSGFRDSETLKAYCDIMVEYDPTNFNSIYHSYKDLQNISEKLNDSKFSTEFATTLTEISTLYNNYNVLLYSD